MNTTPLPERSPHNEWLTAIVLLLVLIVTRSGHFGSMLKLPDASWAMFWLCGALTTRWWWPALLMIGAAMTDYLVISHGISSYCVTPAYPFLILAYLSLWFSGRRVADSLRAEVRSASKVIISIVNGVTIAFIISNASFYAFAGYFPKLSAWQYTQDVIHYWPHYLIYTAMYVSCGLLIRFVILALKNHRLSQPAQSS